MPVTAGQLVSVADHQSRLPARAAHAGGQRQRHAASFTFQVQDDGGTANGGVDLSQSANTSTINVNAVNDAPAGTDDEVTSEDTG